MTPSSRPTWGNGANIEPYPEGVLYYQPQVGCDDPVIAAYLG